MFTQKQRFYDLSSELEDPQEQTTVKVGILHSLSGTMAISETSLKDAELMAIAEINQSGGVLGKLVEPIIEDGASEPIEFRHKARKLIQQDRVATVFGCWTSAARKSVLPVFEECHALLWYPLQYEGLEASKNIFYIGSCPNQQVEPAVTWLCQNHGTKFYLIGSDYIFPRTANKLIKAQLKQQGGTVVGEDYVHLGFKEFTEIIAKIQKTQPDVVFNTLNGDSNLAFYRQYQGAGITADDIPIMAVSLAEVELQHMGDVATGHYASWSYFQSLDTPANLKFVQDFQAMYGSDRVTSDPIEAAYTQVYLWKQAVETAQSFAVDRVRVAAYGQCFEAPGGFIQIESNHHVWKGCKIGKILPTGQFEIIFSSPSMIKPLPWLGVEEFNFPASELVIELLTEVSQWIQRASQFEQKSMELEAAVSQLQNEITERKRAENTLQDLTEQLQRKAQQLEQTIQELQETQTQLVQTEKMSALGQLVAGVAHEINNPLSFISGNLNHADRYIQELANLLHLYQQYYPEPVAAIKQEIAEIELDYLLEDLPKLISSMGLGAERINQISVSLRNFSRSDTTSKIAFNIHDGIDSTIMILKYQLKENDIQIIKEYGDLPLIECYPGQLNQVFMNIIANAIDALNEYYGHLAYEEKRKRSNLITIQTEISNNNEVMIRIKDNAMGMGENVKARIFDNLFTTKRIGKGTGLGLSISYQIVTEKHGGQLWCESELGKGSEFMIKLPIK